jgi:hypothetical protein
MLKLLHAFLKMRNIVPMHHIPKSNHFSCTCEWNFREDGRPLISVIRKSSTIFGNFCRLKLKRKFGLNFFSPKKSAPSSIRGQHPFKFYESYCNQKDNKMCIQNKQERHCQNFLQLKVILIQLGLNEADTFKSTSMLFINAHSTLFIPE